MVIDNGWGREKRFDKGPEIKNFRPFPLILEACYDTELQQPLPQLLPYHDQCYCPLTHTTSNNTESIRREYTALFTSISHSFSSPEKPWCWRCCCYTQVLANASAPTSTNFMEKVNKLYGIEPVYKNKASVF